MTAPKDPLAVKCETCGSGAGTPWLTYYRDMPMIARGERKPHAARVRAAERKEKTDGK